MDANISQIKAAPYVYVHLLFKPQTVIVLRRVHSPLCATQFRLCRVFHAFVMYLSVC